MILGVFGSPGAGKTTALRFFEHNGVFVLNADVIVHDLYRAGEDGSKIIRNVFGLEFLDLHGNVDRKKLSELLVQNPEKLSELNHLIHPLVFRIIRQQLDEIHVPLIVIESVYFDTLPIDSFLKIDASKEICFQRMQKKGMSRDIFELLIISQPFHKADFIIENTASVDSFFDSLRSML